MHISFHQLANDIDVFKPCSAWRSLNIDNVNNILVIKELYARRLAIRKKKLKLTEEFDFSHNSFGIN
jgi:hypothetical protein